MAGVHEDFGEKIGGAKKDLWKDRGLYADDLEAMNEREAEKFVKKDNVWKKPDYAAMLEEGIPLGVVYFIKKARDGLNASPQYYRTDDTPEKRTARQKEYIKTVRELQTVLSDVRTVEDAMRAYDRFFVDNGYLEKVQGWVSGIHYRATKKGQDNPVITNKLSNTMLIRPPVIGVFPLVAGMFDLRCTKIFQSPVDRLCCRCLLFPLFCSSHHDFIGFLLPVNTSLAHGFQAIGSHCDQSRNIHIFTNYAVFNFKL